MLKKYALLIISLLMLILSACLKPMDSSEEPIEIKTPDMFVGLYFEFIGEKYQDDHYSNFNHPNAFKMIRKYVEESNSNFSYVSIERGPGLLDMKTRAFGPSTQSNRFNEENEFSLYFGHEHYGIEFTVYKVYLTKDDTYDLEYDSIYGLYITNSMSVSYEDKYEIDDEIIYRHLIKFNFHFIDRLETVVVKEFDDQHQLLVTETFENAVMTDYYSQSDTVYIILERHYQTQSGNRIEYELIERSTQLHMEKLYFLNTFGYVENSNFLRISFTN